jgi:hypothetical protein
VKKDPEFSHTRRVLEAKRKSLKSLGKGNKPNRAEALSSEEISLLREKGIIGTRKYYFCFVYSSLIIVKYE